MSDPLAGYEFGGIPPWARIVHDEAEHPHWCDPALCDGEARYHRSRPVVVEPTRPWCRRVAVQMLQTNVDPVADGVPFITLTFEDIPFAVVPGTDEEDDPGTRAYELEGAEAAALVQALTPLAAIAAEVVSAEHLRVAGGSPS